MVRQVGPTRRLATSSDSRAAMGGERERAQLKEFEKLLWLRRSLTLCSDSGARGGSKRG